MMPADLCEFLWDSWSLSYRQLGGTFIFAKGGETLVDFRQEHFGEHLSNVAILEALGLDSSAAKAAAPAEEAVCTDTPGH